MLQSGRIGQSTPTATKRSAYTKPTDNAKSPGRRIRVGSDGTILGKHRKINTLSELLDPPYAQGSLDKIQVVETPIGRIGMLVCADTFKVVIGE